MKDTKEDEIIFQIGEAYEAGKNGTIRRVVNIYVDYNDYRKCDCLFIDFTIGPDLYINRSTFELKANPISVVYDSSAKPIGSLLKKLLIIRRINKTR